jgi:hypothetical protein
MILASKTINEINNISEVEVEQTECLNTRTLLMFENLVSVMALLVLVYLVWHLISQEEENQMKRVTDCLTRFKRTFFNWKYKEDSQNDL